MTIAYERTGLTPRIQVYEPKGMPSTTTVGELLWAYEKAVTRSDGPKRPKPKGIDLLFCPTRVNVVISEKICPSMTHSYQGSTYSLTTSGLVSHFVGVGASYPTQMDLASETRAVITNCRLKLKEEGINLAVAFSELHQTIGTFTSYAKDVARLLRAARKRDFSKFRTTPSRLSKEAADQWLRFTYGVRPLISDLNGALRLAEQARPFIKRVTSAKQVQWQRSKSDLMLGQKFTRTANYEASVRCLAFGQIDNPVLGLFTQLGLTNPAELAWELIPYSFVLDWFINVGDVLASVDALTAYSRVSACVGSKQTYSEDCGFGAVYRYRTIGRTPVPFGVQYPSWDPSFSWSRVTSALSLLRQLR